MAPGGIQPMSIRGGVVVNGTGRGVAQIPGVIGSYSITRDGTDPNLYTYANNDNGAVYKVYGCNAVAFTG